MAIAPKRDLIMHSKHYRERTEPIKYIIIHCSAPSPENQIKLLDDLGLSVHYIIGKHGKLVETLPPEKVAYHAGESHWQDSEGKSLNGCSIGIELENPNLGQSPEDYTRGQIYKLVRLLKELIFKYKIRKENILGHSDIAPARKPDPGAGFPWKKLMEKDVNIWYNLTMYEKETNETELLKIIGYDTTNLVAARYAFCRHFIPEEVIIEPDIMKLLDNPYPKDFMPKNQEGYIRILRATARAYTKIRERNYWYMQNPETEE